MQTYTAHFVAPKPYVPLRHILSPDVKLCMEATKCAANVDTICRRRQIVQGRQNVPYQALLFVPLAEQIIFSMFLCAKCVI